MSEGLLNRLTRSPASSRVGKASIREVRLRLPKSAIDEIQLLATAEGLSMNALVAAFIDAGLTARGRKSLLELAPDFADYLTRSRDRQPPVADEDFT